ncbi:MAG: hypothetical protein WBG39_00405, partial [Gordonia sp. (in: high G+C Gram-positive bacteria)]
PQAEVRADHPVAGDPGAPVRSEPIAEQGVISFWTGKSTVVLDATNATPLFQVAGSIGAGTIMAGQLLVPMPGAISVRRAYDGREEFVIPVDRKDAAGREPAAPVSLRVIGSTIVEQRDSNLVALH